MNMSRSGFTIVEIMVIVTVITILVSLSILSVSGMQSSGRDSERKIDIEAIAMQLETVYSSGYDADINHVGRYPSTTTLLSDGEISVLSVLRDVARNSTRAPGETTLSIIPATNATETAEGVTPQPTINQYIYQPITSANTLCTGTNECRRFNLYYKLETTDEVQKVTSKNQ